MRENLAGEGRVTQAGDACRAEQAFNLPVSGSTCASLQVREISFHWEERKLDMSAFCDSRVKGKSKERDRGMERGVERAGVVNKRYKNGSRVQFSCSECMIACDATTMTLLTNPAANGIDWNSPSDFRDETWVEGADDDTQAMLRLSCFSGPSDDGVHEDWQRE